jgi:hypothetical protein
VRNIADEWAAADGPAHVATSLADSNFEPQYDWVQRVKPLQPQQKDRVLFCVRRIVEDFCEGLFPGDNPAAQQQRQLQHKEGHKFLDALHGEWKITDDADLAAERVWSSQQRLTLIGGGSKEFCGIFSQAMRADRASTARVCAIFARGLKTNLVGKRDGVDSGVFPVVLDPDTGLRVSAGETWRGGGFDDAHRPFFAAGRKYRVPGFLATSARQAVTNDFMFQAEALGLPVVQWRFVFDRDGDPRGANLRARRCKHVNLLRESHVADEEEYLFQAYSVFTVASADFSTAGTAADPYRITLTPAIDNALEPEDLPLAPWS